MDILTITLYWDKGLFGGCTIGNFFAVWFERELPEDTGISIGIRFGRKVFEKVWE